MWEEYEVSIVIMPGNLWKWPSTDKALYELGDIVLVISPPEAPGSSQLREIWVTGKQSVIS